MDFFWILLLALSLSMDTFAVAVSGGIVCKKIEFRQAVIFSSIMAFFQGMMPVIGWIAGKGLHAYIEGFDHWVASGLLLIIAIRMIAGAIGNDESKKLNPLQFTTMLTLATATSIDALAVGFSFSVMDINNVFAAILLISIVTFFASMIGLLIGKSSATRLSKYLEILGACILIAIAVKILMMHL